MASDSVFMARRDRSPKDKAGVPRAEFLDTVTDTLADIQNTLFERAKAFRAENSRVINARDKFDNYFKGDKGGFALAHWNGDVEVAKKIQEDLAVTIRCIPDDGAIDDLLGGPNEPGKCIFTGEPSEKRVIWSKAY